jgi:hypothetical protein
VPSAAAALVVPRTPVAFPLVHGLVRGIPERLRRTRLATANRELDAVLGGGLPCGAITEVCGNQSSGRTALAHALVADVLTAGECAAWVDLPNALDPAHAQAAGIALERVLWIHPLDTLGAFRAAEYVLGGGGFRLVVLDLDAPSRRSEFVPTSRWLRLTHAAVRQAAAVVVLSTAHVAGTFATLSVDVSLRRRLFLGAGGPGCLFAGMTSAVHLHKNKLGPPGSAPVDLLVSTAA